MSSPVPADLAALETSLLAAVSELLKTLGAMTPDERREKGPLINGLRDRVTVALADRRAALREAALDIRLAAERVDVTLPPPVC